MLFKYLESWIDLEKLPENPTPPDTLLKFGWHFIRQAKGLLIIMMMLQAVLALATAAVPYYIGVITDAISVYNATGVFPNIWLNLIGGGLGVLVFGATLAHISTGIFDFIYTPQFGNMMRRQLHHYTLKHSMNYFQNDFAGRITNKVMESGPALRNALRSGIGAVWYAGFFATVSLFLLLSNGLWLAMPVVGWLILYGLTLRYFVPKVAKFSHKHSLNHSELIGKAVDSYTNIITVKLNARRGFEDKRTLEQIKAHTGTLKEVHAQVWYMQTVINVINACLIAGTVAIALHLLLKGQVSAGVVAMAIPLVWQMTNQSHWIMYEVTDIFEYLGRVQECIDTICKPLHVTDKPNAVPLEIKEGHVSFKDIHFDYHGTKTVFDGLNLDIPAGQKIGLVGTSGAGKSSMVSLLLRLHDLNGGGIFIDEQNIANVKQDSLREKVATIMQDTSLMHRSITDNIRYGRPDASMEEVIDAAQKAHAHDFILELRDNHRRTGYEVHVGERGVKLSGGQRQRIAIARAILKNAPILILDEATSALDSESEKLIQESLETLMEGKTVIAIAHRLSTLQEMDRLIIMSNGKIIEDGSHKELLRNKNGHYRMLWKMQSGGFLPENVIETAA